MSRTKHYCQSNYKATEYCQSGHIELTWVSRERKLSTSHCLKQLIRLVPRTAVVATLGIVTAGKWSSVLTFPSFLLGLCDAAGSKSAYNLFRNWWISLDCCSLIFRILSSRCFCSISKSSELDFNLPPSVLDWLPSPFPVSGCQGIPIRNLPSLLLFSRIRSSKNPQILRFLHWSRFFHVWYRNNLEFDFL